MRRWTPEVIELIRETYKTHTLKECAEIVGQTIGEKLTVNNMKSVTNNHKIRSGRTGRFESGSSSWNKGKKMKPNANSQGTQFKKGHRPHNYQPIGTERINPEGYIDVKVADPKTWKPKHRILYEAAYGPIPKGHVVIFLDQNKLNLELSNLKLISRKRLAVANKCGFITQNAELTETGLLVAEVRQAASSAKARMRAEKECDHVGHDQIRP